MRNGSAHLRENIGGPSRMTILRHLKKVRTQLHPGPSGCRANMEAIASIWGPIIAKRRASHPNLKVIMVELSEDESGITPRIEYWRERDSILGSCGLRCDDHKCNDNYHPVIGNSWDNLVNIMRHAVPSAYIRVIMCNPLNNWLPPMTCLANATCNKFDHVPHVTSQWEKTLKEFEGVLRPLGCILTGRGSDGDGRRAKLQMELATRSASALKRRRTAAVTLQRRWRRQLTFAYVVLRLMRTRGTGVARVLRISTTFTTAVSLEGAKGFTFAVSTTCVVLLCCCLI